MGTAKKPFCCRLRTDTIRRIKKFARDTHRSQADVIEHWAHNINVTITASPGVLVTNISGTGIGL